MKKDPIVYTVELLELQQRRIHKYRHEPIMLETIIMSYYLHCDRLRDLGFPEMAAEYRTKIPQELKK